LGFGTLSGEQGAAEGGDRQGSQAAESQGGNATPTEGVGRKNLGSPIGVLTEVTEWLAGSM